MNKNTFTYENIVIGAGPAGLQMAYYMQVLIVFHWLAGQAYLLAFYFYNSGETSITSFLRDHHNLGVLLLYFLVTEN